MPVEDALLRCVLNVEGGPLGAASLRVAEKSVFGLYLREYRHLAHKILLFQGRLPPAEFSIYLHTEFRGSSVDLDLRETVDSGNSLSYDFFPEGKIIRFEKSVLATETNLSCTILLPFFPHRRFDSVWAYLDDMLVYFVEHDPMTVKMMWQTHGLNLPEARGLTVYSGPVSPGEHIMTFQIDLRRDGAMDIESLTFNRKFRIAENATLSLACEVPPTSIGLTTVENAKLIRIAQLKKDIVRAFKSGSRYGDANQDGGWEEITFRDDAYIRRSGNRMYDQEDENKVFSGETELFAYLVAQKRYLHGKYQADLLLAELLRGMRP